MSTFHQPKRHRNPEQIRELLQRYQQSHLTQAQFAAREGICVATLHKYRQSQTSSGDKPTPGGFVEVERPGISPRPGQGDLYRVCLPAGVQLEIAPGFCPHEVASLLEVLAKLPAR